MTKTYMIVTGDGNALSAGLSAHEVARVAQSIANRLGRTVYYSESGGGDLDADDDTDIGTAVEPEITDAQIDALRTEAAVAGDLAQVEICDRALSGDESARAECKRVIADASARGIDAGQ